jgi:hypothetical protein
VSNAAMWTTFYHLIIYIYIYYTRCEMGICAPQIDLSSTQFCVLGTMFMRVKCYPISICDVCHWRTFVKRKFLYVDVIRLIIQFLILNISELDLLVRIMAYVWVVPSQPCSCQLGYIFSGYITHSCIPVVAMASDFLPLL